MMKKYQILLVALLLLSVNLKAQEVNEAYKFHSTDAFYVASVSDNEIQLRDKVILTYRFYTLLNIQEVEKMEYPDFTGFIGTNMDLEDSEPFELEMYKGQEYHAIDVRKVILYPKQTGTMTIEPASIDVVFSVPVGEPPYTEDTEVVEIKQTLTTKPITLTVLDNNPE